MSEPHLSGKGSDAPGGRPDSPGARPLGRRHLLGAAGGALLVGGAAGALATRALDGGADGDAEEGVLAADLSRSYPLRGEHQAGIVTPAQDYLFTAAFDVTATDIEALRDLMSRWCVAAEQMCAGELVGGEPLENPHAPPRDTGEAWGYPPSSLTLTFGVGPSLFVDAAGSDRFGLAAKATPVLRAGMPRFGNEALRAESSDGDLMIQACADDAQVAIHAIRALARIGFGTAAMRWTRAGYGRTSSTSAAQETPRNLFGFKDGTANPRAEDTDVLAEHLWVAPEDEGGDWLAGGTYMALRTIRMHLETWDRESLQAQEAVIGRDKRWGAPLSVPAPAQTADEFAEPDFHASEGGRPLIADDAHIRVVAPEHNEGARMLRRGYNYTDGADGLGKLDGGLFFVACVRDPRTGFYPVLERMTQSDALTEYLQHVASGLFAILPGIGSADTMIGQKLLA